MNTTFNESNIYNAAKLLLESNKGNFLIVTRNNVKNLPANTGNLKQIKRKQIDDLVGVISVLSEQGYEKALENYKKLFDIENMYSKAQITIIDLCSGLTVKMWDSDKDSSSFRSQLSPRLQYCFHDLGSSKYYKLFDYFGGDISYQSENHLLNDSGRSRKRTKDDKKLVEKVEELIPDAQQQIKNIVEQRNKESTLLLNFKSNVNNVFASIDGLIFKYSEDNKNVVIKDEKSKLTLDLLYDKHFTTQGYCTFYSGISLSGIHTIDKTLLFSDSEKAQKSIDLIRLISNFNN